MLDMIDSFFPGELNGCEKGERARTWNTITGGCADAAYKVRLKY